MNGGAPKLKMIMEGRLHGSAHVWIWRKRNDVAEVLVQKRAMVKINWPGFWDKSAGGHISYGEKPTQAAVRKAKQEIGVQLDPEQLKFIGVQHWRSTVESVDMIENEYQWIYIVELPDSKTTVPTREVAAVEWQPIVDLEALASGGSVKQYVPYGKPYYVMVFDAITQTVRLEKAKGEPSNSPD